MRCLSLFNGASGLYMALQTNGVTPSLYVSSEIDKYALRVNRARVPGVIEAGDVTNLTIKDGMLLRGKWDEERQEVVGDYLFICKAGFDLIAAGSPCQGFSYSGIQKGFDDPRSKLFWHFVRLLKEGNPKYWMLENVMMKKEFQSVINESLGTGPVALNSADFSAQNRKRLYWCNWKVGPAPEGKGQSLGDILQDDVPEQYYYEPSKIQELAASGRITFSKVSTELGIHPAAQRGRYKINGVRQDGKGSIKGKSQQYIEVRGANKSNCLTTVAKDSLIFIAGIEDKRRLADGKTLSRNFRESGRIYSAAGKAAALTASTKGSGAGYSGLYLVDSIVRRLTPVECERLQGWPDGWASDIVSPTQTHKLCGNGWNVLTVAHVFRNIC